MSVPDPKDLAVNLVEQCTECGACVFGCPYLQEQGTPRQIAARFLNSAERTMALTNAFHCSMCGLCASLCPERLKPADFFRALRIEAIDHRLVSLRPYKKLLTYEALGQSILFADRIIPDDCDTILFPGCTFPGTRPDTLPLLIRQLQEYIPNLGIVMDCCSKPSHDLGRRTFFEKTFERLHRELLKRGIRNVLTVCPNCQNIFSQYGTGLETRSVTTWLASRLEPRTPATHWPGVLHIPCPIRGNDQEILALRHLAESHGMTLNPLKHKGRRSPCCGEGGAVSHIRPDLAAAWTERCRIRAGGSLLLTACAGCEQFLRPHMQTVHILDLLFLTRQTLARRQPASGLRTYLNRILLRIRLRRQIHGQVLNGGIGPTPTKP